MASLKYNNVEIDFGTGADGALTVNAANSPYIITTNKNFTNVTVSAGGVLVIARPLTATFTATIFPSSTTLTVSSGTVTGTIGVGNEIVGGPVKLGTTIASGSSLSWVLSQTQFSTVPAGGVTTSGLTTYGVMPLVKISGTLTVSPASGATAAGIIRGDYQDDIYLPFVNSGSGIEFIRNSAAYDSYNNSYFQSGNAQQWPGALYGRNGAFNNPDNSIFNHQEEFISSQNGYRNQDRYGGDYGRGPAGGGGGSGYSNGTGGINSANNYGTQPGGGGGYQNSNNLRPSFLSLTNYYDNISVLYDGHRGGNAGDSSTTKGLGGKSLRIISRNIINNGLITANGTNGTSTGGNDPGGGGGGGAGTVIIFCEVETGSGAIEARGGSGGAGGNGPSGWGGQGGGGTIQRYVGVTRFTGSTTTTGTSSVTGTTTGYDQISGLQYVPDVPLVLAENTTPPSTTGTITIADAASEISFNHTIGSNSDRLLLVMVQMDDLYNTVTSVSYNSKSLTKLYAAWSEQNRLEVWYCTAPDSGTNSVAVVCADAGRLECGAIGFYGVSQSYPFRSLSSQTAGSFDFNAKYAITKGFSDISAAGDLICSFISTDANETISMDSVYGGSQLSKWSPAGTKRTASLTKNPSVITEVTSWSFATARNWCVIQCSIANSTWDGSLSIPSQTFLGANRTYSISGTSTTSNASTLYFYHGNGGISPETTFTPGTAASPLKPNYPHNSYVQTSGYTPSGYNGFWKVSTSSRDQTRYQNNFQVVSTANPGDASVNGTITAPAIFEVCPNNLATSGTFLKLFGNIITLGLNGRIIVSGIVHFCPVTSFNINGATIDGNGMGLTAAKNSAINWYYYNTNHGGSNVLANFPGKVTQSGKGNNVGHIPLQWRHLYQTAIDGYVSYIRTGQANFTYTFGVGQEGSSEWYADANWYGVSGTRIDTYDGGIAGHNNIEALGNGGGGGGNGGTGGDGGTDANAFQSAGGASVSTSALTYAPFSIGRTLLRLSNTTGGVLKHGFYYRILSLGTSDFTTVGASSNTVGTYFKANVIRQQVISNLTGYTKTGYETGLGYVTPWPPYVSYSYMSGSDIYDVWIFKPGTTNITTTQALTADILIVGGGGSGGASMGGGGGGGQVREFFDYSLTANRTYSIIVGSGGQKSGFYTPMSIPPAGYGGNPSSFGTITSLGGGAGGGQNSGWNSGGGGASGGGNGCEIGATGTSTAANSSPGTGQPAGSGFYSGGSAGNNDCGGGGGGASSAGSAGTASKGGDGGNGISSSITGQTIIYGAGGGGGARSNKSGGYGGQSLLKYPNGATGGTGGGNTTNYHGNPGTKGTGSGGGGGGYNSLYSDYYGGHGADGTVIIRIKRSNQTMAKFNLGNQVTMGGGGGAGNNFVILARENAYGGVNGADGGNGGACVVVTSLTIAGSGLITVNGEEGHPAGTNYAQQISDVDGHSSYIQMSGSAGGGGAGGTIYLRSKYYNSSATFSAVGGKGGDNLHTNSGDYRPGGYNGFGGGGGGGKLLVGSELFVQNPVVTSSLVAAGAQGTNGSASFWSDVTYTAPSTGIYQNSTVLYFSGIVGSIIWF
jgi:hypothetical protein